MVVSVSVSIHTPVRNKQHQQGGGGRRGTHQRSRNKGNCIASDVVQQKKKGKGKHDAIPSNRDFEKEGAYSSFRLLMDELIVLDKLFMHAVSLGNATFPSRCPAHLASCYRKEKNLRKSFIVGRACRFFVTAGPGRLLTSLNLDFCSVLYYILLYY